MNTRSRELMKEFLEGWLSSPIWTTADFMALLSGEGEFPPVGGEAEPYAYLLRGLPVGNRRPPAVEEFARRAAALLGERPDLDDGVDERALYNLFRLCLGLACPDRLAEPLFAMLGGNERLGKYGRNDLRAALRAAMIHNQMDQRLWPVWDRMLKGEAAELPGRVRDGFEGVAHMPESGEQRSRPDLEKLGWALRRMADELDNAPEREAKFADLLGALRSIWLRSWNEEFRALSMDFCWPLWTKDLLGASQPTPPRDVKNITMPNRLCLYYVGKELGWIAKWKNIDLDIEQVMSNTAAQLERNIEGDPFNTPQSILNIETYTLSQVEAQYDHKGYKLIADAFMKARRHLLQDAGIMSS